MMIIVPRTGVKDGLEKSGAYPMDFGARVAELHLAMLVARRQLYMIMHAHILRLRLLISGWPARCRH